MFLLSVDEVKSLFADNDDRETKPTAYAIKNGAHNGNAFWWLRSRGDGGSDAAVVYDVGGVNYFGRGVYIIGGSVRPAFRIAI